MEDITSTMPPDDGVPPLLSRQQRKNRRCNAPSRRKHRKNRPSAKLNKNKRQRTARLREAQKGLASNPKEESPIPMVMPTPEVSPLPAAATPARVRTLPATASPNNEINIDANIDHLRQDRLGNLVRRLSLSLAESSSWHQFVKTHQGTPLLAFDVGNIPHAAAAHLTDLREHGVPA